MYHYAPNTYVNTVVARHVINERTRGKKITILSCTEVRRFLSKRQGTQNSFKHAETRVFILNQDVQNVLNITKSNNPMLSYRLTSFPYPTHTWDTFYTSLWRRFTAFNCKMNTAHLISTNLFHGNPTIRYIRLISGVGELFFLFLEHNRSKLLLLFPSWWEVNNKRNVL